MDVSTVRCMCLTVVRLRVGRLVTGRPAFSRPEKLAFWHLVFPPMPRDILRAVEAGMAMLLQRPTT